jgi:pimeloyl-ACP methyl ester carboxylesterase
MKQVEKRTGHFKSFDGTPIYYEVRGEGKPIVLTYGIVCLINHWRHQLKYFSEKYQTIVFDLRGHHSTPVPEDRSNLSIDAIARDMSCLLEHLKIEKASFWGHSFGGQLLLKAFDINPEMFANMVFINGFATNPLDGMFGTDVVNKVFAYIKQVHSILPETFAYIWKKNATNPLSMQLSALAGGFNLNLTSFQDIEIYSKGVASIDADTFLTLFEQMAKYDGTGVLDRIEVPTMIIGGQKDSVTPAPFQEVLHQKIRGSQYLVVPHGTHCTQLDMPDFVNLKIEKFLKDIGY